MKLAYIISNVDYFVSFDWISDEIHLKNGELYFIFLNASKPKLQSIIEKKGIPCKFIILEQNKSSYIKVLYSLIKYLKKEKIDVVHAHYFHASFLGLIAAKFAGVKRRIYSRHHSTSHHEYFPKTVKYDKLNNYLATNIVAVSNNVSNVLREKENVKADKIHIIEHGFDLKSFQNVPQENINKLRKKYNLPTNTVIIGAISRYVKLKGISYLIEAFSNLLANKKINAHLVLANARGPYADTIKKELSQLPHDSFTEISFENDLFSLYQCFDVFVHIPINSMVEAYGQIYVEALAAGIPSVFTLSGIANDFIVHEENALVVDYKNSQEVEEAIYRLLTDKALAEQLKINGLKAVERFSLEDMINKLEDLYELT